MEILLALLVLLGFWGLFIWLCSRIGGWIGITLYNVLHSDQSAQERRRKIAARQAKWEADAIEALKRGEKRFGKLD